MADEVVTTDDADSTDEECTDGGERPQTHTIRLELVDKPGELLSALRPIAENGGNLLSIFHERGNLTPRGHIPVEVDVECPPDRFETIVAALREEGVNVIQAGAERYGEQLTLLLVGDLVDTDLSDTLQRIESSTDASIADLSLSSPEGRGDASSARLRMATRTGRSDEVFDHVRKIADEKDLDVIEPLVEVAE
ncbi:amino acid-binding protein [Haloplanus pelagicus]|jgi:ACT domain-containing protein|uniref:amino acid-binding protein n=1 Tax=Haloplanus pelagicus TaxID=2949995 RepID=UPI002041E93C|nr:amino acid-binding protein [Haloplanus sp. HW8-1]